MLTVIRGAPLRRDVASFVTTPENCMKQIESLVIENRH